jgi:hypothetical protein
MRLRLPLIQAKTLSRPSRNGSSSDTLPPSCFDWIGAVQVPVLSKNPSVLMDENADEAVHVVLVGAN